MTITTDLGTQLASRNPVKPTSSNAKAAAVVLTGSGVAAFGLSRRNWAGLGLAAGGAVLAYQGMKRMVPYVGSVRISCTINRSAEELFDFVRESKNWRAFARGIEVGTRQGQDLNVVFRRAPGFELASLIRITDQQPAKFIAWSSLPGAIEHRGVLHFHPAPGNRGTELSVALEFKISAGQVTQVLGMLYGQAPQQLVRENLRRLKQFTEAGEIPTTQGQPAGNRGLKGTALRVLYREPRSESVSGQARMAGD